MRLLIFLFIILSFSFSKDLILVSIYPFYDVVKDIAGSNFRTEVLVPPKADYHLYELTPREIIKLYVAKIVFVSGVPLGEWEKKVEKIAKGKVYKLSEGISLISYGHKELGKDPHFWTSPKRMLKVVENVYNALRENFPKYEFTENYLKVKRKVEKLHRTYLETLSSCKIKTFGAIHPAFGYVAQDYGLKQIPVMEEHGHGDISPKELRKLVRKIRKGKIKVILIPKGFHSKLAKILRRRYGIKVYEVNVKIIPNEFEDYYSIMKENLNVLRKALKCM